MQAVTARTRRAQVRPDRGAGRRFGKMARLAGQGQRDPVPNDVTIRQEKQITLNTNPFCEEQAGKLGLTPKQARWWERERRVCHIAKVELPEPAAAADREPPRDELPSDRRLADAELRARR